MIIEYDNIEPKLGQEVFVAPDAWVIGRVTLGDMVSVFFGAVLRGDLQPIRVGARCNIQEHCLLHTTHGRSPTLLGDDVTVGHRAILHGCSIGSRSLIGMGAIILDDAEVGDECLVGAGSLITERQKFPNRSLIFGSPARKVAQLDEEQVEMLLASAENYVKTGASFRQLFEHNDSVS